MKDCELGYRRGPFPPPREAQLELGPVIRDGPLSFGVGAPEALCVSHTVAHQSAQLDVLAEIMNGR
jgi:hypothetical protein